MKVLVPVERLVDKNVRPRGQPDGFGIDPARVKTSIDPFDGIAVEEAVQLKAKGMAAEMIARSCGVTRCRETLRAAVGADRAVLGEVEVKRTTPGARPGSSTGSPASGYSRRAVNETDA